MASDPNGGVCLIRRVVIRNYKSIAACDVELGPLTFLVGPNGSGKSNFLDALRFVSDALRNSLEYAVRSRGGAFGVLRKGPDVADHFAIRVDFQLTSGSRGHYAFHIMAHTLGVYVQDEECSVSPAEGAEGAEHYYRVSDGVVQTSTLSVAPPSVADRLYLVNASGTPTFRPVYDALSRLAFYSLNPTVMREVQTPGSRDLLERDGANLPSVIQGLEESSPALKSRIEEYLAQVVPSIDAVDRAPVGHRETLIFNQRLTGKDEWAFPASDMSDGTLRAVAILAALFQRGADADTGPPLIGIEEPETALHPAASGVLIDAMRDAVSMRQVVVASHSPELLDNASIADSEILAVVAENGRSVIGHLDEAGRSVLRDHLFTPGDLLRMNQLRPGPAAHALNPDDLRLFGTGAPA
jgi:predicted ATPase